MARDSAVALGFAPHSGWAAVVAIGARDAGPYVATRERIEMADPGEPESRQPFHAVESLPVPDAGKRLAVYQARATRLASDQIRQIVDRLEGSHHRVVGVGLLESSGRKGSALAAILASHALIHTADGDHFRNAIALAAEGLGLGVVRVPARTLALEAAKALGKTTSSLQDSIRKLGREVGSPWAADQQAAALVAWLVVARESGRGRRTQG